MKLRNIFIFGGLLAGMALTTACDDQLSALPTQSKVEGNVVVDQKSAIAALNGIYYQFAQCKVDNYGVHSTGCAQLYEIYPSDISGVIAYTKVLTCLKRTEGNILRCMVHIFGDRFIRRWLPSTE